MTTVDVSEWAKVNLWRRPSWELAVRPGLRRVYTPDSGRVIVGGFSILNKYSNETWHYVFDVADSGSRDLRLRILDDNFVVFQVLLINADAVPRVITYAVVEGQIVISSPDFPTLWGLVGSGMRIATKEESDEAGVTELAVPRGIVSSWCNRVVIGSGSSLFISDPVASTGGSPRTFRAANQNARPATIYGLHEGAGDMLVVVTAAGTYGLDSAASAVAEVGSNETPWRVLSHHPATSYGSSCVSRGRVYALSVRGWVAVDVEDGEEQNVSEPVMSRAYGPRIESEDYRSCRLYGTDDGPLIAYDDINAIHRSDVSRETHSWWRSAHSPTNFHVRGLLRGPDGGEDVLLCENGAFAMAGNFDGEVALSSPVATQPIGLLVGAIPTAPAQNPRIESIEMKAEAGGTSGGRVYCAVRGAVKGPTRPQADKMGVTIGVDSWGSGAPKRYTATPMTSVKFAFNEPTQDIGVEIGVEYPLARIGLNIDMADNALAPIRPQKTV